MTFGAAGAATGAAAGAVVVGAAVAVTVLVTAGVGAADRGTAVGDTLAGEGAVLVEGAVLAEGTVLGEWAGVDGAWLTITVSCVAHAASPSSATATAALATLITDQAFPPFYPAPSSNYNGTRAL